MNATSAGWTVSGHPQGASPPAPPVAPPKASGFGKPPAALMALIGVGLLGIPTLLIALLTPKYAEVFRDFGVRLPLLTKWFIEFGQLLATPLGALAAAAALLVALGAVYAIARASRPVGVVVLILCALWALAAFVLFLLAMYVPLNSMINSLQGGGAV